MNILKKTLAAVVAVVAILPSHLSAQQYKNPVGKEFPILAWYSILPKDITPERFRELREAGFNLSTSDFKNLEEMKAGIKACKGTGVCQVVSCPEMDADPEPIVRMFMHNRMTAGYFLRDEPSVKDFPELGDRARRIAATDPKHFVYLDLFPTYAPLEALGVKTYREYVQRSVDEIGTGFISYDHYPVTIEGLRPDYYENLEIVSSVAAENNRPFWAFALALEHGGYYPLPTREGLRYQVFSDLAYGAQGLEYFTYWGALVGFDGKRTEVYDLVKEVNKVVQALAPVFLGAKVVSVRHTGDTIPAGTKRLDTLPEPFTSVTSDGPGLVVSHFTNGDKSYLMLVNRTIDVRQKVTVEHGPGVRRIMQDGSSIDADAYSSTLTVDPGDCLIYQWK
ncbi:MAG: hypothetical protein MJY84_06360 [Bacteroidales bacterium]|nr:hypothetical protein [Bacteroidales bacterium]